MNEEDLEEAQTQFEKAVDEVEETEEEIEE